MRLGWLALGLVALASPGRAPAVADDPGFGAQAWLNSQGRTTVQDFKGEVLLLEDFATW